MLGFFNFGIWSFDILNFASKVSIPWGNESAKKKKRVKKKLRKIKNKMVKKSKLQRLGSFNNSSPIGGQKDYIEHRIKVKWWTLKNQNQNQGFITFFFFFFFFFLIFNFY